MISSTFGSGAGGDSGLLKATTSPTKRLPTDGLGIHRMSSFSTEADVALAPRPLLLLVVSPVLLPVAGAARVALSVGACAICIVGEEAAPWADTTCKLLCMGGGPCTGDAERSRQ